jgi:hypothetical protein
MTGVSNTLGEVEFNAKAFFIRVFRAIRGFNF